MIGERKVLILFLDAICFLFGSNISLKFNVKIKETVLLLYKLHYFP